MKVLVTGASGFIGQAVCTELSRRGIKPVPFDHPDDVRKRIDVQCASHVDGIINLAGVLGTAETIGVEYHAAEVNILGALNVMDAARDRRIPMVQIATGHEGTPNPYAITKKCITDISLSRAQWTGQKIAIVRAFHVYGPGQKMVPPHGRSTVKKIVPCFVSSALTNMPLQVNGDGLQKIDLVYLDDVARVLVGALEGPYGKVVDAGTGHGTTVLEAARTIVDACMSQSVIEHVPMRKGEPESTTIVAQSPLCPHPWPYKLAETIEWYRRKIDYKVAA